MQEHTFELCNVTQKMHGSKWRSSRTSAVTPINQDILKHLISWYVVYICLNNVFLQFHYLLTKIEKMGAILLWGKFYFGANFFETPCVNNIITSNEQSVLQITLLSIHKNPCNTFLWVAQQSCRSIKVPLKGSTYKLYLCRVVTFMSVYYCNIWDKNTLKSLWSFLEDWYTLLNNNILNLRYIQAFIYWMLICILNSQVHFKRLTAKTDNIILI